MKSLLLPFFLAGAMLLIWMDCAYSQSKYTFSGTVRNAATGEALIGAVVDVAEMKSVGTVTNSYGFYSLTLPQGRYTVRIRYLGFTTRIVPIVLSQDHSVDIDLTPEPIREKEVVITGERSDKNVTSTEMGTNRIEMKDVQSLPALFGERDIMKTIQLLPGIKSAGEGNTGYNARGGSTDQNLILLDEAPVYNSSHLLGFLSVFNADAIKDVKVMTGSIPAEYGGRLSSVLDIRTSDGNMKTYGGSAGIGLIASRFVAEGPIVKDEGSFLVSGRRTYADLFLRLSNDTTINRTRLYFYDLNAKVNERFGDNNRLFLSGYFGRDNFDYPGIFGFTWGNTIATARWNHVFGNQLFSNASLIYSDFTYSNTIGAGTAPFVITSGIRDVNFKADFQYFPQARNTVAFGINAIWHTFVPGTITSTPPGFTNLITVQRKYALEDAAYLSDQFEPVPGLDVNAGLRVSSFSLTGPGVFYSYDPSGDVIDSATYGSGAFVKTYAAVEPRLSVMFPISASSSVKAAYTRTAQYLHLLSNSTTTNPSDLWMPSTNNIPPQYADQYSAGYFRNFDDNGYETSVEVYYKNMQHLIDYRNGADLQLNPLVESMLIYGKGWSYGAEFLLRKTFGPLSGWLAYTISKSEEQFAEINHGQPFPARQDRTHDIAVVAMYDYDQHWNFAATWVYNTGNAVTFPSGDYIVDGRLVPYYTERNGYRMPAYHRLDLSATYQFTPHSNLNVSVYNAYDRANAYAITFRQDRNNPTKTEAVKITLFPIIPSITYSYSF